ncbi:cytochrome P450 [Pyronema omphalodes]|nr:cytochrome P450 [Pyronema omphalodes]
MATFISHLELHRLHLSSLISYINPFKAIFTLAFIYFLSVIIYRLYFHPLRHVPGPKLAAITDLYGLSIYLANGRWEEAEYQKFLHRNYGPVVRYGPNTIICSAPSALPIIYHRHADKTTFYNASFGPTTSFSSLLHADHVIARKRLASGYSMTAVKQWEHDIDMRISDWIQQLDTRYAQTGADLLVYKSVQYLVYDVVTEICFGEPLGFIKEWKDIRDLMETFDRTIPLIQIVGRLPTVGVLLKKLNLYRPKPGDNTGFGMILAEVERAANKYKDLDVDNEKLQMNQKASLFFRFMTAIGKGDETMTVEQVQWEGIAAMVAGSRTVADQISPTILNILKTPRCLKRLQEELDTITEDGIVSYETAMGLPYFSAVLKEGLRSSGQELRMPRMSPAEGLVIEGVSIPAGVSVACSPLNVMFDEDLYGADAKVFRPERYLEADEETLKMWERYNVRFGYGTRACIGRNIAMIEVAKAIVEFFRVFDPELVWSGKKLTAHMTFKVRLKRRTARSTAGSAA